jgi:MtN3 and saliva related transmembrane protein
MNSFNLPDAMMSWEIFGWLAALCFSISGLPQAIKSYRDKHSDGISWAFLILWLLGEIFATLYVLPRMDVPLLVNYFVNGIFIAIIIYYKTKGKRNEQN